jgi:recombination protein RecA
MNQVEKLKKELSKDGFVIKTASELQQEKKIRTGVFGLDYVLDGGITLCEGGHRIEFFGAESTGKTTLALHVIKKFQELGKVCAFIDAEKAYDKIWGEIIGIDNKNLLIAYPDTLEDAGNLFVKILSQIDLIIIDSVVSLIPSGEAERETEEAQMALTARINSLITRKIYRALADKPVTMIFINQLREKVGQVYGSPYTTSGGHALKHMYNTRVEFKIGKVIKDENDEKIGYEINLNCVKNKKGKPFHVASLDFYLNGNLDNKKSIFYAGIKYGIIERSGNSYNFKDLKIVGQENFLEKVTEKELADIETEIWKLLK